MNKRDSSVLKVMECLRCVSMPIVSLGIASLAITSILVHARQPEERVLYRDEPYGQIREPERQNNTARTPEIRFAARVERMPPPDLAFESAEKWRFEDNDQVLVISVIIKNSGKGRASKTTVLAQDPDHGWSTDAPVAALGPGKSQPVDIRLPIPNNQRGIIQTFLLIIDPDELIDELDEGNNIATTPGIPIPPPFVESPPASPTDNGPGTWRDWLPGGIIELPWRKIVGVLVIGTFVVGAMALTARSISKAGRRRKWQEKAREEEPPEKCRPCTHYCRKIELELEPRLRKITNLNLTAHDPVSGEQSKTRALKGRPADSFNKIVTARRRRKRPKKLQKQAITLSRALLREIMKWLHRESAACDVSVTAHLEGGKVTCQFTLYHCKRRGTKTGWQEIDKWKKSIRDKRDVSMGTLSGVDPVAPAMEGRLVPQLTQMILKFIEKV